MIVQKTVFAARRSGKATALSIGHDYLIEGRIFMSYGKVIAGTLAVLTLGFVRASLHGVVRTVLIVVVTCMVQQYAYATSQCYQWRARAMNQDGEWQSSPQAAFDALAATCMASSAAKQGCESSGHCYYLSKIPSECDDISFSAIATIPPTGAFPAYVAIASSLQNVWKAVDSFGVWYTYTYPWNAGVTYRTNPAGCQVYVSALFSPPAQCGPTCNGVSDPINPTSGTVYSTEPDTKDSNSAFAFKRFYNSTDVGNADLSSGWRHSFSRTITPVYSSSTYKPYETRVENSSLYNDEAAACTSGFAEIKSRVSTWANATATYSNGMCVISVGTTVIARLPILYTSPPTPAPNTTTLIAYDATRDDGQSISFAVNSGSIAAPPSVGLTLQQINNGYTLTDANDTVETYDTTGKLLTVTSRTGVVQAISYDASGRLSSVSDTFGHQLSLSYDTQNRLITVTRQ
jgi:YD repeat-containing protein